MFRSIIGTVSQEPVLFGTSIQAATHPPSRPAIIIRPMGPGYCTVQCTENIQSGVAMGFATNSYHLCTVSVTMVHRSLYFTFTFNSVSENGRNFDDFLLGGGGGLDGNITISFRGGGFFQCCGAKIIYFRLQPRLHSFPNFGSGSSPMLPLKKHLTT